jgi:DNA mismatch repair ATPase MutS
MRWLDLKDSQHNLLFAPLAFIVVWPVHVALAIESWRTAHGRLIGGWLAAAGEIEALAALATYAYENPADVWPEIVTAAGGARFEAEGFGHPLIPPAQLVRNDLRLNATRRFVVVSGSNMSGKSTLLRAVGMNTVLALAGAPVRALRLVLTPMWVGGSIGRHDSLKDGISHFYAEVKHLARLAELAAESPLLFLLDELLHGTNSHDRRAGGEALLRNLIERGAIGLLTTHDLALTEMLPTAGAPGENVHFADQVVDGKMVFDYRMRPGIVERGNALALMRAVGLEV